MMNEPSFSVIIPTYNRQESLSSCLHALVQQNHPGTDFEVIVVDDGSHRPIGNEALAEFPGIEITLLRNPENLGPSSARNWGAARARGKYLAFTDDDCLPDRNWLARLKSALETAPTSAAGGGILDGSGGNLLSAASHLILEAVYKYYNDPAGTARFFATLNMAVPAREFSEIGGFRPDLRTSEDREFCARWLQRGHRMIYVPEATVVHKSLVGLRGFWRRHYHYGMGAYRFRSLQAKNENSAMVLAPAGFYWDLIRYPLAKRFGLREIAFSFLIMISQIASLFGFMTEWRRGK
jgi:glycosyltransferase involved in cell wall biosynthesis